MTLLTNEFGELDSAKMRANGTLSHEAYIKWDEKIVQVAQSRLTFIDDLNAANLVDTSFNLGDITSNYEKISEMTAANVNMKGITSGERDILTFTEASVPIPLIYKNFQLDKRSMLAAADRPGRQLSTTHVAAATRVVAESINDSFWNGFGNIKVAGAEVFGLTNFPQRNTKTITNAWGGGSETPTEDVLDMIQILLDANFYGPFNLYVSKDNWTFLKRDYSDLKGDRTHMERLQAITDIANIKLGEGLDDGELVLVQMTEDVLDLVVAQDFTSFEQPQVNSFQHDFTVMTAMALRVKSDQNGNCGVVHATGA